MLLVYAKRSIPIDSVSWTGISSPIVAPAAGSAGIYRITVTYFTAP